MFRNGLFRYERRRKKVRTHSKKKDVFITLTADITIIQVHVLFYLGIARVLWVDPVHFDPIFE